MQAATKHFNYNKDGRYSFCNRLPISLAVTYSIETIKVIWF